VYSEPTQPTIAWGIYVDYRCNTVGTAFAFRYIDKTHLGTTGISRVEGTAYVLTSFGGVGVSAVKNIIQNKYVRLN
jgi:hypothetical protein